MLMLIFLQVRIFKILMKVFKVLRKMVKIFTQVGILKAMKMTMSIVDTMLMMIFLQIKMMEMLPRNIVSRSRSRPFHINPRYSSYTRGRAEYLTRRSSISALISSECCQKDCLKHMDFKFALEKRKRYLSMNKSMQNSYLVGCMQSTLSGYDYHIGSLFICRKAFKMFHSIGNFRLSRIQENLEKDPTFFSKHGECMPNKDTIHIPDNFSR
jgi:hypothetical protein